MGEKILTGGIWENVMNIVIVFRVAKHIHYGLLIFFYWIAVNKREFQKLLLVNCFTM